MYVCILQSALSRYLTEGLSCLPARGARQSQAVVTNDLQPPWGSCGSLTEEGGRWERRREEGRKGRREGGSQEQVRERMNYLTMRYTEGLRQGEVGTRGSTEEKIDERGEGGGRRNEVEQK
ncbi:hypothetical protein E2C01_050972 [Portunus trituberculatus]|uniref:Uncharacterized protein n=1 Tax=Portunus trituberculatus TaxID=210409 RepID=A0A5B7GKE8_PORTR|nr:hypothetical protein [Portunus trituberculatus]